MLDVCCFLKEAFLMPLELLPLEMQRQMLDPSVVITALYSSSLPSVKSNMGNILLFRLYLIYNLGVSQYCKMKRFQCVNEGHWSSKHLQLDLYIHLRIAILCIFL